MNLQSLMLATLLGAGVIAGGWLWHAHDVSEARQAGWDAAVSAAEKQRAADAAVALTNERALRAKLAAADDAAHKREQTYAENLVAAQSRIRTGADSLRIAVNTIRATAATADRPAAGGSAVDEPGATVVPEVAGDILGLAGDTARLVRKYERLIDRYDACVALNNGDKGVVPATAMDPIPPAGLPDTREPW